MNIYASSLQEEKVTLDSWIRQRTGDPHYAYIRSQPRFDSDPRNSRGGLGDDHLKSFDYMLSNIRTGCENYYTWFSEGDRDMTMRKRVYSALCDRLNSRVYAVLSYVGGIYLNDIREKDVIPSYSMVDREKQKAALNRVLRLAKELDWIESTARATDFTIADKKADMMRLNIFKNIFNRLPYIEVCTERFPETAYTASEYLDDIYNVVWEGTLKRRPLENVEKALQTAFLESIIATSTVTAPIGSFKASKASFADTRKSEINLTALREGENVEHHLCSLQAPEEISGFSSVPPIYTNQTKVAAYYFDLLMRTKEMLEKSISTMPEADRSHYDLLIYRINKAVEIK